jgi:hypothetical protein
VREGGRWLLCERVGTVAGALGLLRAVRAGGWGVKWSRSGFARGGLDDGGAALPVWVLEACRGEETGGGGGAAQREDVALSGALLRHWARRHPERGGWRGEGWALHAVAERDAPRAQEVVWGVTLRLEGGAWWRLQLARRGEGLIAYQADGMGSRLLTWGQDPVGRVRAACQRLDRSFDVVSVFDPARGEEVAPQREEAAYALGLMLWEADFSALEELERASRGALGEG